MKKASDIKTWTQLIGNEKMQKLRNATHPPGKKALWLAKHLSDEELAEVYYRIFVRLEDTTKVCKMIRDVWGINKKWEIALFKRGLNIWRRRLATAIDEVAQYAKSAAEKKHIKDMQKKLSRLYMEVDPLGTLGHAIAIQTERLLMLHEREVKANRTPMRITDTVQSVLTDQLKTYALIAIKTGVVDSAPSEINVNLKGKAEFVLSRFIENDGQAMIDAGNKFLELASEKAIQMTLNEETGLYEEIVKK